MKAGPLRRALAVAGLIALLPIAVQLFQAAITPQQAAGRAVALLLAVLVVGRISTFVLGYLIRHVENDPAGDPPEQ